MSAGVFEPAAPPLARRLACFLYEGVLLFGLVFVVGLVYGIAVQQRSAIEHRAGLSAALFTTIGIYFVWCWTRAGQTLPMQTWHIRLVTAEGGQVPAWRATLRYLACWLWFVPPLWASRVAGVHSTWAYFAVLAGWVLLYAASARLLPQRQFLHDVLCGTRLVTYRPAPRQ